MIPAPPEVLPAHELSEWSTVMIEGVTLAASDRRLASELSTGGVGRIDIDELVSGVRIRAREWVGVVRFEHFEVRIVPKLAGDNLGLLELIEFTTGIDALKRSSGARTLATEPEANLFDLIALLCIEECDRLVRNGLLADYIEEEDELAVLRGRWLFSRQLKERYGRPERLICRFDERHQNILENQLLAVAMDRAARRGRHLDVRRRARVLRSVLDEACDRAAFDDDTARQQIQYGRLNEHYRSAHVLSRLVLEAGGVEDLHAMGSTHSFAFLIDMNSLFERFVERLIERVVPSSWHVYRQRRDSSIIWNVDLHKRYATVIPDLLIDPRVGGGRLAVDAKYKTYDLRRASVDDIMQSFLYAYAYSRDPTHTPATAVIVFPASSDTMSQTRLRVRSAETLVGSELSVLGVPIPRALREATVSGPSTLLDEIRGCLDSAIGFSDAART